MNRITPQDGPRVRTLPFPSAYLYVELTENTAETVWSRLAANSLEGKFSLWQRLSGIGVTPASKVWHLLYLHRRAFEAEMLGYRNQADFYWRDLEKCLRRVWDNSRAWDAAATQLIDTGLNGMALRRLCMDELFLDSHIALAHGLIRAGAPYRAAQLSLHMGSVERLLRVKAAAESEIVEALSPLVAAEVAGLRAAGMNATALARLRSIKLQALKQKFCAALADLVFDNLMRDMERLPNHAESSHVSLIAAAIAEIEGLRVARPDIAVLYQLLGILHQLQCVQLANEDMVADALVACEKARTYWPALEKIEETQQTLCRRMSELQKIIAELGRQVSNGSGQSLSADGFRLKAQAERGFKPVQNFIASSTSNAISVARDAALAQACSGADEDEALPAIDQRLCISPLPQCPGQGWSRVVWLFAAQDGLSQAMLAGAVAFNLAVGAITAFDLYERGKRNDAVAALGAHDANDEQVMAAAVRFLSAQTPGLRDARSTEVKKAYAHAFTRWFSNIVDPANAGVSPRIAEYRKFGSQGDLP